MTKPPKTIGRFDYGNGEIRYTEDDGLQIVGATSYTRADLYEAALARIDTLQAENERLRGALNPDKTKAAYIGEIIDHVEFTTYDENGELDEMQIAHAISWSAMKQFMAMILAHAALTTPDTHDKEGE